MKTVDDLLHQTNILCNRAEALKARLEKAEDHGITHGRLTLMLDSMSQVHIGMDFIGAVMDRRKEARS